MKENFVRKYMKKMAAIGTGVAMVGATLTGAMAADLGDYPSPFVVDGNYDDTNVYVVGNNAAADDTLGLIDVSTNLGFESKTAVETEGGSVSVAGGTTEQVALGKGLSNTTYFDTTLEDDDVDHFWDGVITFQGKEYDTSEQLQISTLTDPLVTTSLVSSEDDYTSDVYLETTVRDVIRFAYKFDESINLSKASTSEPLTIDFLGDTFQVTTVAHGGQTNAGTQFTAYVGEEVYLGVDEEVVIEGKTVVLQDVSSTSAVIVIDGVSQIVAKSATETINGLEVTVDDVFSRTERSESSANLIIGEQASETYKDGDSYVGEDTSDPNWVWDLAGLGTSGTSQNFSIENDFVMNDLDDGTPGVGGCIALPNDYVEICLDSLTVGSDDYGEYTFEFESSNDFSDSFSGLTSEPAIHITSPVSEGIELQAYTNGQSFSANETTNQKVREMWLYTRGANGTLANNSDAAVDKGVDAAGHESAAKWVGVFYKKDDESKIKFFGDVAFDTSANQIALFNYGNTKGSNIALDSWPELSNWNNQSNNISVTLDIVGDATADLNDGVDDLDLRWGLAAAATKFDSLGDTKSSEEADELRWGAAETTLGTKDEDHRSFYGIIIKNPKSNGASDTVVLEVPQDQVFANVVVKGSSTTVTAGDVTYIPAEITPVTKKASEVSTVTAHNLILAGGPCANELVEGLFDLTCDGWPLESGQAMLRITDNGEKVALLMAGTTADDTRRAGKALAQHATYDLSGTEIIVSGTSIDDVNIETPSAPAVVEEVVADEEEADEEEVVA
jgi:hypothetical protein